jgi:hypothetical protein
MNIFKTIFGRDTKPDREPSSAQSDEQLFHKASDLLGVGTVRKAGLAANDEMHVRQVVVQLSAGRAQAPKFGSLMLPPDYYPGLNLQSWHADFFDVGDEEGPYLMVRADEKTEQFRNASLVVAYTFCRFDGGGLVASYVAIDLPGEDTPWGGVVESCVPLDTPFEGVVKRISNAFDRNNLHMCFAGAGVDSGHFHTTDGASFDYKIPRCEFDRLFFVGPSVSGLLKKEFASLQSYHASLSPTKRSAQHCIEQMNTTFPKKIHPIIGYRFVSGAA